MRLTKQPLAWRMFRATQRLFRASGCFCLEATASSGVGAHRFEVPRQRRHRHTELCSRMRRCLPVVAMLVEESLLNFYAGRALAGKRPCPVDLKALSADRTAHIAIAL